MQILARELQKIIKAISTGHMSEIFKSRNQRHYDLSQNS